jgi:hypothetical protein
MGLSITGSSRIFIFQKRRQQDSRPASRKKVFLRFPWNMHHLTATFLKGGMPVLTHAAV